MSSPPRTLAERLAEFYSRLGGLPPAGSADEALEQVRMALDAVEDAYSGVPKQSPPPPANMPTGRMYPPLDDHITRHADGSLTAVTRGHVLEIGAGGSILIKRRGTGQVEFSKQGT